MKTYLILVLVSLLVAVGIFYGGYSSGRASVRAEIVRDTVTVRDTLTLTVHAPAVVRPSVRPALPPARPDSGPLPGATGPAELPNPLVYALDTVLVVGDSIVSVTLPVSVEFDPRSRSFLFEARPIVEFVRPRVTFNVTEVKRDPWWLRPVGVLGSGVMVWGLVEDEPLIAGLGGVVTFYSLVIEL